MLRSQVMLLHRYASDLTTHPFHVNKKMDFFQKAVYRRFQFYLIMFSHAPGSAELKKNLLYSQISLSGCQDSQCMTSSNFQCLVVTARCEKFVLSIITSKVFDLECSATTQIEEHKKFFAECTYLLHFRGKNVKIRCLIGRLCVFLEQVVPSICSQEKNEIFKKSAPGIIL